jgi:hypothetical protein
MSELTDDELLAELGVNVEAKKSGGRTPREERLVAGFEDIQRFYETHGRAPLHGEGRDIFERLYAVRLDRLRTLPEAHDLLAGLDVHGLLVPTPGSQISAIATLDDEAILAALGVQEAAGDGITALRHVGSADERRVAEEIANRERCTDFETFKPVFDEVQKALAAGIRQTRGFELKSEIEPGNFFIVGGQTAYVAAMGEVFSNAQGIRDARLRVIFDNGTESNMLMRSLQRALHKDEAGRRITNPTAGPLFSDQWEADDIKSGIIYVLRSHSNHPFVAEHRELIHKIGVTGGKVETRIANAARDATYLLADVEIVATYKLADIKRTALEAVFHRIFAPAQLDLTIQDRFGHPVRPREWFLVPLHVIDEAVQRVRDGSITGMIYDPTSARLVIRTS